jgi:hypothetical protein
VRERLGLPLRGRCDSCEERASIGEAKVQEGERPSEEKPKRARASPRGEIQRAIPQSAEGLNPCSEVAERSNASCVVNASMPVSREG